MPLTLELEDLDFRTIVRPGSLVSWGQASGEPLVLTRRLMEQRHGIGRFSAFLGISVSETPNPEYADVVDFQSFCGTANNRRLVAAGKLDILPVHFSQLPAILGSRIDVLLLQLAQHPTDGRFSLSTTCDYIAGLIPRARLVVAEINARAPFTDAVVAAEDVDVVVHTDRPLAEFGKASPTDVERKIAAHVTGLIEDGATLQLGIGSIPDYVATQLTDRRELGIHTGVLTEGGMHLIQAGAVTNARKGIDTGMSVAGCLIGGRALAAFCHLNPTVSLRPVSYTHSQELMARIRRLVALNSAIEVDLSGQVNTEIAGGRYVGAVGGAVEFARAANASPGGIPIVALPSTTEAKGQVRSRIVPTLNGPATISRADTGVVVTEHGVADLRGASFAERARRLTAIADPRFREGLEEHADTPAARSAAVG